MSNVFQTQCPNCQHTFAITQEQLNLKSGYARCGGCQSIFPANQHIIGTVANPTMSQPLSNTPATPRPAAPTPKLEIDDGIDFLFDDSAGLDETGQLVKHDIHQADKYQSKKNNRTGKMLDDFEILDNFDSLDIPLSQPTKPQHISQDQNYDDSWVKDLLDTDSDNTPTPPKSSVIKNQSAMPNFQMNNHQAPNDVANMLENMGVNVVQERMPTTQEYQEKIKSRFEKQQSSQHEMETSSGGMGAIWFLGSLLLAGALLAQYVFFNINDLVKNPDTASKIDMVCGIIPSCSIPVADTTQLNIQSQSLTATKNGKSDLIFTMQNKGSGKSVYPNLKISLRDGNDVFAQFIITPKQYLSASDGQYLLSQQVHPVKLRIDTPSKKSSQANIEAFY